MIIAPKITGSLLRVAYENQTEVCCESIFGFDRDLINESDLEDDLLTYTITGDEIKLVPVIGDPLGNGRSNNNFERKIEFISAPDYELKNLYKETVTISDGAYTTSSLLTIEIIDVDEIAPVISITGDNPATVELGATYVDSGATADGDETVTTTGTVDTNKVGSYTLTYSATDAAGNTGTATRTVNVQDTSGPVINILGDNPQTVELVQYNPPGSVWVDPGATLDNGELVSVLGDVDNTGVGTFIIEYSATDNFGNKSTVFRTVYVVDTTAPSVILLSNSLTTEEVTIELGSIFVDTGAYGSDLSKCTGQYSECEIEVTTSGTVDTSKVGTYTLTYSATDASGNTGTATRTVNVVDTSAPVITVTGDNPVTVELGATYTDAGATADGGETVTTTGTVDTSKVGTYTLTYSATDASGNTGTATRTVNVVDTSAPVITVTGDNPVTVELGATYTDAGATADGGETVTTTGTVDTSKVGTYTLTYSATDASGNTGTATRTVNVVDTSAPVITVTGDNPVTVELGATYTDAGATADGGETVTTTGTVDTSKVGTYTLTYSATDASGNTGTATRTVNVVDTSAPVITVTGDNPVTVELGATYTDAGATADGGETVTTTGTVDTSKVGTYTLTYSATDASGNTGTATRTVNVVDTSAPVITVTGDNPVTVELGATYTDAGATADGGETVTTTGTVDTSKVGTYTLTYSATDASGNTGTATRTVNVVDTSAPVITSKANFTAAENQTAIGTVVATDLAETITFTISESGIVITPSGVLTFIDEPDYETKTSYSATVTASDGTNSSTQDITVNVTNVNDNSPAFTSLPTFSAVENQTAIGTVAASDADGDGITYSISVSEITINNSSGVIAFASAPDYETKTSYSATVTASDGANSSTQDITVNVIDVVENSSPVFTSNSLFTVAENQTLAATITATDADNDSISFSLSGTDAGSFTITSSGALTFNNVPDYETKESYSLIVIASDGISSVSQTISINISNVNEVPQISALSSTLSPDENQTSIVTVSASDPDANTNLTYSVSGTDSSLFTISSSGVLTFKTPPDYETPGDADADNSYQINVIVSDGSLSVTQAITIQVQNVADLISGVAVDGYVAGATVFQDLNNDGDLDSGEPSAATNSLGSFSLNLSSVNINAPVRIYNGFDLASNEIHPSVMDISVSETGSYIVTPISTLVGRLKIEDTSLSAMVPQSMIAGALGISLADSPNDSILGFDPIAYFNGSDTTLAAEARPVFCS